MDKELIFVIFGGMFLLGFVYKMYLDEKKWSKKINEMLKGHK